MITKPQQSARNEYSAVVFYIAKFLHNTLVFFHYSKMQYYLEILSHHCVTVRPDSCLASSVSDQFCSCISFLTIATLSMQLPPINYNWSSLEFIGLRFTSLEYFYSEYILTWFLQFGMMRGYLTLTFDKAKIGQYLEIIFKILPIFCIVISFAHTTLFHKYTGVFGLAVREWESAKMPSHKYFIKSLKSGLKSAFFGCYSVTFRHQYHTLNMSSTWK